jgi:hypothetical protein
MGWQALTAHPIPCTAAGPSAYFSGGGAVIRSALDTSLCMDVTGGALVVNASVGVTTCSGPGTQGNERDSHAGGVAGCTLSILAPAVIAFGYAWMWHTCCWVLL